MVLDVVVGHDLSKGAEVDTSKAAWSKARDGAAQSRQIILDALAPTKGTKWIGATCKELSTFLEKPMHKISGRITELIEIGAVRKTEIIRDGGRVIELV